MRCWPDPGQAGPDLPAPARRRLLCVEGYGGAALGTPDLGQAGPDLTVAATILPEGMVTEEEAGALASVDVDRAVVGGC